MMRPPRSRQKQSPRFTAGCVATLALIWATSAHAATGHAALLAAIDRYNDNASPDLPVPDDRQLRALLNGEVVRFRERTPVEETDGERTDRIRIVGYRVVERPRLLVWLAALNIATRHSSRLTEHPIAADAAGGSLWYQYLRLPWPLRNRHWVIRNEKRTDLAAATGGAVWEHAWRLEDDGHDVAMDLLRAGEVAGLDVRSGEKALYLPVNRGGWTMIELDETRVLVAVHVISVLGGWIPDGLIAGFVSRQLDRMLTALDRLSLTVHEDYDTRFPVFTGEGTLITPAMAAARQRR